jgi:hypothetical protein
VGSDIQVRIGSLRLVCGCIIDNSEIYQRSRDVLILRSSMKNSKWNNYTTYFPSTGLGSLHCSERVPRSSSRVSTSDKWSASVIVKKAILPTPHKVFVKSARTFLPARKRSGLERRKGSGTTITDLQRWEEKTIGSASFVGS